VRVFWCLLLPGILDNVTLTSRRFGVTGRSDRATRERNTFVPNLKTLTMGEEAFRGTALKINRRAGRIDTEANDEGSYGNR
jgi:hypothetical protein